MKIDESEKSYGNFVKIFFGGSSLPGGSKISKSVTVAR